MHEFSFKIDRGDKPILYVKHHADWMTSCLIDTGANMPVWFIGDTYLKFRYPDATPINKKTILNGLGDNPIMDVPIWNIPHFVITDDFGEELIYENLPVAVIDTNKFSFDMIISLTMFNRMSFSFDYLESAVNAFFRIKTDKTRFFVKPVFMKTNEDYMNRIQIFAYD